MNAVGIDVSKGKSMVAIMRPFGEIVSTPFEIKHTSSDINSLVKLIKSIEGESRIVMEHTGRYYEVLAHQLSEANLFVSAINPKLIKDFVDCQHFFRQIFLGYFSDIVQAFDTLRKNVCGDDYTSLHNPIVLSSVLPAYGMFHSIQILFL